MAAGVCLVAPAWAAGPVTVAVTGPASGVVAYCPPGMRPGSWSVTGGDGSPLAGDQRQEWTVTTGVTGIAAWIAPYDHSPPPPATITLTVVCVC
ncbi:hypothetical protein [Streptacidiphilus sp. P02-A3a]|uniref:hypothetical protein n=1 Tax=Streptacidiphilus sp. P02-A3a TaxID=2704468 RepID=UPI001CDBC3B6|nr:hypothetical protein [Streptacidiphilus sp. P02-A3a]